MTRLAVAIKFFGTLVIGVLSFYWLEGNPFSWIVLVTSLVTAVNFFVGDWVIFSALGNIPAAIGDGLMAALVALLVDMMVISFQTTGLSLAVYAVLTAMGEYFYHKHILSNDRVAPG